MSFAIGQYIEAILDHRREQLRAPAAAVKDDGDLSPADHAAYFAQQAGHGLRQRSIDLSGNHQQRITGAIVDPVIRRRRHRQMAARNVGGVTQPNRKSPPQPDRMRSTTLAASNSNLWF